MFGFKKKENKIQDPVLYNFDHQPVINTDTGEFLMDFDFEQQKILRQMIDWHIPIGSLAYRGLPAQYMNAILFFTRPDSHLGSTTFTKFDEGIMYKIVHTDLDIGQFTDCLLCLINGIDICGEVENVASYPHEILSLIARAATLKVNLCKRLKRDMDVYALSEEVEKLEKKAKQKEKFQDKLDMLEYKIFIR